MGAIQYSFQYSDKDVLPEAHDPSLSFHAEFVPITFHLFAH